MIFESVDDILNKCGNSNIVESNLIANASKSGHLIQRRGDRIKRLFAKIRISNTTG